MKNEETRLLGVDVKNIISVLAVTPTHNGRLVDCVRDTMPKKNRDRLSDDAIVANIYAALSAKHKDSLVDYVQDTLLWQNHDFFGYTEDDYVLARLNGEVEKLTLAEYLERMKTQK